MRQISVEEISSYKKLPFNLYNENGEVIMSAGELITPGKLLKLRYIVNIFSDGDAEIDEIIESDKSLEDYAEEDEDQSIDLQRVQISESDETPEKDRNFPKGEEEDKQYRERENIDYEDNIDEDDRYYPYEDSAYENKLSCLAVRTQQSIKNQFKKAVTSVAKDDIKKSKEIYIDTRDQVVEETLLVVDDLIYKSQLKVYGEHDYVHSLNVAILSTVLAHKLKLSEAQIKDIALAAMLHDIGKLRLPKDILDKQTLTTKESKLIQLHPQIGYRIIKKEMGLPENIAIVALEHHERNDGSGYPYGTSGELISLQSQIIMICDAYDNMTSNRGSIKVKNSKEAIKVLLDGGSRWFTPNILYTFVYMSNYDDNIPLAPQ